MSSDPRQGHDAVAALKRAAARDREMREATRDAAAKAAAAKEQERSSNGGK